MSVYQISVFLENRAGQVAEITGILAENGVDLRAISIAESCDYGVLRLIVEDAEKATGVLLANGYILSMTPVVVVSVPDQPGGLAPVLALLAKEQLDIEYMYSLFTHQDGKAYIVFRMSDVEKFRSLLEANGIQPVNAEELGIR